MSRGFLFLATAITHDRRPFEAHKAGEKKMERFRVDPGWLPRRLTVARIDLGNGERARLLVSYEKGWQGLLELAGRVIDAPEDETLRHLLAAYLYADSRVHGEANLARIARVLLDDEEDAAALLQKVTAIGVKKFREAGWRYPLVRRLAHLVRKTPGEGELPWVDFGDWLDAAERVARSSNSDHADRKNLIAGHVPRSGFHRRFAQAPEPAAIEPLAEEFPNFAPVAEHYAAQVAIAKLGNGRLRLLPVLLLGEAGIGKTAFSQRLAEVLGVRRFEVAFGHATQGGSLGGLSSFWGNGKQGAVFDALLLGREMNPVFLLDEIDKAVESSRYDPLGCLYALLEAESARRFTDEFAELPIDAGWFSWVATANGLERLPAPIQSRLVVFEVRRPTACELRQIGRRQYRRLIEAYGLGGQLPGEPPPALLEGAVASPRELGLVLQTAIGRMARDRLAGRAVQVEGLALEMRRDSRRMGFI
ncbi:MAG: AAA family ATPase [Rhodocyclales bacterium]|nr:AAA family ATPase [Rhodocyclales bacterium]